MPDMTEARQDPAQRQRVVAEMECHRHEDAAIGAQAAPPGQPRDEIRGQLWPEGTFVDFDQSVNFAIKQIRDAFGDSASRPLYVETVPRQGYRFVAPIDMGPDDPASAEPVTSDTVRLEKAMWANIAELRVAQARQRKLIRVTLAALVVGLLGVLLYLAFRT